MPNLDKILNGIDIREALLFTEDLPDQKLLKLLVGVLNEHTKIYLLSKFKEDLAFTISGEFTLTSEGVIIGKFNIRTFNDQKILLSIESGDYSGGIMRFTIVSDFVGKTVFSNESSVKVKLQKETVMLISDKINEALFKMLSIGIKGLKAE